MLFYFDLVDEDTTETVFDGQNWMEIELSLFDSIPK